ncbi:UNVERIFIED_CONTAM: hypothetical protein HDU68_006352 [Siphonaria sp. JEL0065]|nr:hypothetical protein HDU68_006352 [Siphonaria sp. JEL0065]
MDALDHKFGVQGQFWMEYSDFLKKWTVLDRVLLLNDNWSLVHQSLEINATIPARFGSEVFEFEVKKGGPAYIVLSQIDTRYFAGFESQHEFSLSFRILTHNNTKPVMSPTDAAQKQPLQPQESPNFFAQARRNNGPGGSSRSICLQLPSLPPGKYRLHPKATAQRVSPAKRSVAIKIGLLANPDKLERILQSYLLSRASAVATTNALRSKMDKDLIESKVMDALLAEDAKEEDGAEGSLPLSGKDQLVHSDISPKEDSKKGKRKKRGSSSLKVGKEIVVVDENEWEDTSALVSAKPKPPKPPNPFPAPFPLPNEDDEDESENDDDEDHNEDESKGEGGDDGGLEDMEDDENDEEELSVCLSLRIYSKDSDMVVSATLVESMESARLEGTAPDLSEALFQPDPADPSGDLQEDVRTFFDSLKREAVVTDGEMGDTITIGRLVDDPLEAKMKSKGKGKEGIVVMRP